MSNNNTPIIIASSGSSTTSSTGLLLKDRISYAQLYSYQKSKSNEARNLQQHTSNSWRSSQIQPPADLKDRLRMIKILAKQTKQRQREMEEKRRRMERQESDARDEKLRARHELLLKLDPLHRTNTFQRMPVCAVPQARLPPLQRSNVVHSCPPASATDAVNVATKKSLDDCLPSSGKFVPMYSKLSDGLESYGQPAIPMRPAAIDTTCDLVALSDEFDRTNRVQDILNRADAILHGSPSHTHELQADSGKEHLTNNPTGRLEQFSIAEQLCYSRPDLSAGEIMTILSTNCGTEIGENNARDKSMAEEQQLEQSIRKLDHRLAQLFKELCS